MSSLTTEHFKDLKQIFLAGVTAVKPSTIFQENRCLTIDKTKLRVNVGDRKDEFDISDKRIHVIGFGKAVLGLAIEVEQILSQWLVSGIISVPHGSKTLLQHTSATQLHSNSKIRVHEGAENNLPDENAFNASKDILKLCQSLNDDDILVCLISGGGSALLPYPKTPLSLEEKTDLTKQLSRKGATINELNCVRIAMSMVKGGQLAAAAHGAHQIISLIISDIINDPIELIASGPTVSQIGSGTDDPLKILEKYDITRNVSEHMLKAIKDYEPVRKVTNVKNYVIANNEIAIDASMREAKRLGYETLFLSKAVQGDVHDVAALFKCLVSNGFLNRSMNDAVLMPEKFAQDLMRSISVAEEKPDSVKGICVISGGEPTVKVTGNGIGGRNQELALKFTEFCLQETVQNVLFLAAGTDGIDGPTNAAGAIGGYILNRNVLDLIKTYLNNNDSYNFYSNYAPTCHIITGHTGTNVMDLQVLLYVPFSSGSNKSSL